MNIGAILFLITARKGSEGLSNKNFKEFLGKPLIYHSYNFAEKTARVGDEICISTNDEVIINFFEEKGIEIPFKRPEDLSTNFSSSDSVIDHALTFYESQGKKFEYVMLLQPTSPFREKKDFDEIIAKMDKKTDMVVSVRDCKDNPYFNMFVENSKEHLASLVDSPRYNRRQDAPKVYTFNGAYYFFKVSSFRRDNNINFRKVKKFLMPEWQSVDIDTKDDWDLAIYYSSKHLKNG
jgi:CMP-N,N'-diacetyllegionaminic acid synthase